ncbi:MAG: M23 family metallopeptidase [Ruminococcaceae bacterium]|nr:M23 family metallopeptidase [Oscillospiraceae bacterium]
MTEGSVSKMIMPFSKGNIKITSPYGNRTLYGTVCFHGGLDLVGTKTDEVVSVSNGTVLWSQMVTDKSNNTWQWGNYIAVMGDDGNTVYYCHLNKRLVSAGQRVSAGDVIGIMGNTGYSFGKHLHFEVRPGNLKATNAAAYLNLPNAACEISEREYYADEVVKACGFTDSTRAYINKYAWSADLWRKIAFAMRAKEGKCGREGVIKRLGLLPHTVKYIDAYPFASELWRKLGENM